MIMTTFNQESLMASDPTSPTLQKHHDTRSWTSTWYDDIKHRRMKRFGKESEVTKKHANALYRNWFHNEWKVKDHVRNPGGASAKFTVAMLCDAYLKYAEVIYRKNGKLTTFIHQVRSAMKKLRELYGHELAAAITGPQIAALRDAMVWGECEEGEPPHPLRRNTVNDRLQIIKRAFMWANSEKGLVPEMTAWSVSRVEPLKSARSAASESERVLPIADEIIEATAKAAPRVIADMIWLCRYTGMRPGEACIVRAHDIEMNGDVWIYRPHSHKTEHKGKTREICVGSRAQEIICRNLIADTMAYLFSPAMVVAEFAFSSGQRMRTACGDVYSVRSLRQAIHRACNRSFGPGDEMHWNPNQLRHKWATEVRKAFDLESAAIGLGHSDLRTAEIYAERDREKAMEVARKVG